MSRQPSLGIIDRDERTPRRTGFWFWWLLLGWVLVFLGYYGAWIAHPTSGLTLSGADMAEFVKFLPGNLDGSLRVIRQFFYLPPLTVVITIAFLIGSTRLVLPWYVRGTIFALAVPASLQLLPPAWSPASLRSSEFMPQTLAMIACWALLALFWLLGRLPVLWSGLMTAILGGCSLVLCVWQMALVRPAINAVYATPPGIGWGFWLCLLGLAVLSLDGVGLAAGHRDQRGRP